MNELIAQLIQTFSNHYRYEVLGAFYFASCLFSLFLGFIVMIYDRKSEVNRAFFLITLTGALWLCTYSLLTMARTESLVLFWNRIDYTLSVPFISPCVYLFAVRWTKGSAQTNYVPQIFITALLLACVAFFFNDSIFAARMDPSWGRFNRFRTETTLGLSYAICLLSFFTAVAAAAFWKLWKGFRSASSSTERRQYGLFLLAFLIGYGGSTDFAVALGYFDIPLGAFAFGSFALISTYSILRYQFLDVNVGRQKVFMFLIVYGFLFSLLITPVSFLLHRLIHTYDSNLLWPVLILAGGIGIVFSSGPVIYAILTRRDFWLRTATTSGLAHELKSPIAAISGATDLLISRLTRDSEADNTTYLEIIQRNTNRLETFVSDLLNLAHAPDSDLALTKEQFDLVETTKQTMDQFRPLAEQKELTLRCETPAQLILNADKKRIAQIMSNLLSNAIRYSEHGVIDVSIVKREKEAVVAIQDKGQGIPKNELEKVFERFYQVNKTGKGSGIGLSIAKAWVEAHGGKIWAESEGEGKGATVTFTLPV